MKIKKNHKKKTGNENQQTNPQHQKKSHARKSKKTCEEIHQYLIKGELT